MRRTGPFGSLHTIFTSASSFVLISRGRTDILNVAVVPGFTSLFPPEISTRSSSQVKLWMISGDFPVLITSTVPVTFPPIRGMKPPFSGNLPKSSNVPDNCATGACAFSAAESLPKLSMILAATCTPPETSF